MNKVVIKASEIAQFLDAPLHGPNIDLFAPRSLDNVAPNSVVFVHRARPGAIDKVNATPNVMAIVTDTLDITFLRTYVTVKNARLAFAKVLGRFFSAAPSSRGIASTAVIGKHVKLGEGVSIGEYSVIEDDVQIGPHTRIQHHVVIARGSVVGANCVVMSHCVIGEDGFGFMYDENRRPIRFPHIGHTEISDNVEIGCFNAIPRAALDKTEVGEGTKTGDFVQIPHNARVGRNCLLAAYAKVGSGAVLEDEVFMGVRSSTRENVRVGRRALIGQGAVVLNDVPERAVMAGVPAKYLRDRGQEGGF